MTGFIDFCEFYSKKPIPIKESDQFVLQRESKDGIVFEPFTHWLIALEGCEWQQEKFQWRVAVYPSNEDGAFNFRFPYFRSPYHTSFNEALEVLREIEMKAKQDQLTSINQS